MEITVSKRLYKVVQKRGGWVFYFADESVHEHRGSNKLKSLFVMRHNSHIIDIRNWVQRKTREMTVNCTSWAHTSQGTSRESKFSTSVSMFCFDPRMSVRDTHLLEPPCFALFWESESRQNWPHCPTRQSRAGKRVPGRRRKCQSYGVCARRKRIWVGLPQNTVEQAQTASSSRLSRLL